MTTQEALGVIEEVVEYLTLMRDASGADDGESGLIARLWQVTEFLRRKFK